MFYQKNPYKIDNNKNFESKWDISRNNLFNIRPPTLIHISDNCCANVILKSLAFLDFEKESEHSRRHG